MKQPTLLVILDGYGLRQPANDNAVACADTPFLRTAWEEYPHATLLACGTAVGLPPGYIGNSEVGHRTIGSGRIIEQTLTRINTLIDDNKLCSLPELTNAFTTLTTTDKSLHIITLLSDAGVHAHSDHLFAMLRCAMESGVPKVYIHVITDGRDVPPRTAIQYLEKLEQEIQPYGERIQIATISGRFYAMDRDNNWDRTDKAFKILTHQQTESKEVPNWRDTITKNYGQGVSDEFITPTTINTAGTIQPGDGVIILNYRPDRMRQLTEKILELPTAFVITPVNYGPNLKTTTLLESLPITDTLIDQILAQDKSVFSIAETEKYAHITYFFTGGREEALQNEKRILIPSIKRESYADIPCMSAEKITETVLESLKSDPSDFYLINYANPDMVGHSGNIEATIKALECIDPMLQKLFDVVVTSMNGTMYITSDHGNAEEMIDTESGQPKTAHTTNPVPFIWLQHDLAGDARILPLEGLKDIAPFILEHLN